MFASSDAIIQLLQTNLRGALLMHNLLLIFFIFLAGVVVGVKYHKVLVDNIEPLARLEQTEPSTQEAKAAIPQESVESTVKSNHCPAPSAVYENRKRVSAWKANGYEWSLSSAMPSMSSDLGFMQVLYYKKNHNIVCYYQFPNPDKPTQNRWVIVRLNPSSEKAPEPKGKHWNILEEIARCNSGYKACVFEFK